MEQNAGSSLYIKKLILAPMVRINTLPMRLMALESGADIVYSEEIIDYKLLKSKRTENRLLETIDYVHDDGSIVFRTCSAERGKVVLQIGTCDAQRALQVARMVENDVMAVDVNMGCPKEFSIKGGMGAALLSQPEKIVEILTTLVQGLRKPVTCKIRILPTISATVELAKLIAGCGVAALAVHGRTRDERPNDINHDDVIAAVAAAVNIPIIANGGSGSIQCFDDVVKFRASTGCSSVMLARAAQWNPTIFSASGLTPVTEVIQKYIKYAVEYDSHLSNLKYCVQQLLHDELETVNGRTLLSADSVREICAIWKLENFYDETVAARNSRQLTLPSVSDRPYTVTKLSDGFELVEMPYKYDRKEMASCRSAKFLLHQWAIQNKLGLPCYETTVDPSTRLFNSVLSFGQRKYTSTTWEKSKKYAEQVAAIICIQVLHMENDSNIELPVLPTGRTVSGNAADVSQVRHKQDIRADTCDKSPKRLKTCSTCICSGSVTDSKDILSDVFVNHVVSCDTAN